MKISYICCFNNEEQLKTLLIPSLEKLKKGNPIEHEPSVLLIDNRDGKYKSAASAFNSEVMAHIDELGDILCFLHQDIAFDDDTFQQELISVFKTDDNQIVGFSGKKKNDQSYSNLRYYATKEYIVNNQITSLTEVECVDECCFAISKILFLNLMFDEKVCYHWHLYAVELCYHAKRDFGTKINVATSEIYHKLQDDIGLALDTYFFKP